MVVSNAQQTMVSAKMSTRAVYLMFRRCGRPTLIAVRSQTTVAEAKNVDEDPEWATAKPFSEVPGPKPLPIPKFGNFWRMIPGIGTYGGMPMLDLNKQLLKEFGPIVSLAGMGRPTMVFIYDPKDAQKVYRTEGAWPYRAGISSMRYYRRVIRNDVFQGNLGVLATQGEEWQKNRTALNQPMMKPTNVTQYHQPVQEVATDFLKRVKQLRNEKMEMPADFLNEMNKWALESIFYIALDTRLGLLDEKLKPDSEAQMMIDSLEELFHLTYKMDILPSLWRYYSTRNWKKYVRASDKVVFTCAKHINKKLEEIKNRPEGTQEGKSMLETLLVQEGGPGIAQTMAMEMVTAGVDTTSNTSSIAMYYISKNAEVQEKLFEELKKVLPNKNDDLRPDYRENIPYLKACIKESQRLMPATATNARRTRKEIVIRGYRIPQGVDMIMHTGVMCRSKEHFPRPEEFIPERWLKNAEPELSYKNANPYVFTPFGFGTRMCIGRRFAEMEMHALLAKLLRNFKISYNYGEMEWISEIITAPNKPLKFQMQDRPS